MSEYGFSLTRIFPYKDRIGFIRENMGQRKFLNCFKYFFSFELVF